MNTHLSVSKKGVFFTVLVLAFLSSSSVQAMLPSIKSLLGWRASSAQSTSVPSQDAEKVAEAHRGGAPGSTESTANVTFDSSGGQMRIIRNGQLIEIIDGVVFIDGRRVPGEDVAVMGMGNALHVGSINGTQRIDRICSEKGDVVAKDVVIQGPANGRAATMSIGTLTINCRK